MLLLLSGPASAMLMDVILRSVLIVLIVLGLWFELHNPGMGFPSVVAAVSAVIYFASLHSSVEGWDILLFVAGVALLFADVILTPGFGILGVSGILCTLFGLTVPLCGFDWFGWNFFFPSLLITVISAAVGCGISLWLDCLTGKGKSSYNKKLSES